MAANFLMRLPASCASSSSTCFSFCLGRRHGRVRDPGRRQSCATRVFATCSCQLQPPQKFLNYAHIYRASLLLLLLLPLFLLPCSGSCCCSLAAPEMVFGRKCYTQRAAGRMACDNVPEVAAE